MNTFSYLQLFWYYPCFLFAIYIWAMSYQLWHKWSPTNKLLSLVKRLYNKLFT